MADFQIHSGQFWYDGRPLLIQAGEFHYFRSPVEEWAERLTLLQRAGFNAVASYIPWLWHEVEPGQPDLTGRTHPMRNLAGFLDLAAEMGLFIIPRPGPYIMAETINEGIPPWFFERYPQAAVVNQHGQVQNIASYLHPDFLACVRGWYRAVFEVLAPRQVTRGGNILLIQLDNEMGMPHWVRNLFDLNPHTVERFADFLVRAAGENFTHRNAAENLPAFLQEALRDPQSPHGAQVAAAYRRFYRTYLREYAAFLHREAEDCGMEVAPVVNIHGFANGGKTFPIGLSQLVEVMESPGFISATDVYPLFIGEGNFHQLLLVNEMTAALQNPAQPLFSIEFQAGGNPDFGNGQTSFYDLHTRLCLSCGMRGINHYLFFDGENDPLLSPVRRHDWGHPVRKDGSLRRHYHRYPHLSRVLAAYGDDLLLSHPHRVTRVGFRLDDFMSEVHHPQEAGWLEKITHQRETILFDQIGRGLALTHRPFDALEISRAQLDAQTCPSLWMMIERRCPLAVQQKLIAYVRGGGRLIMIGRLPVEDDEGQPAFLLREALGIQAVRTFPAHQTREISVFDHPHLPARFVETYTGDFDEVFACTPEGETAGVIRQLERGRVMLLGAALPISSLEDLAVVDQMALRMGIPRLFEVDEWLDLRLSEGENGSFLFVNNYQDDPVESVIRLNGQVLFGERPLRVEARRGLILPLEWRLADGLILHYLTAEVTGLRRTADEIVLNTAPARFTAEIHLPPEWQVEGSKVLEQPGGLRRFIVEGEGCLSVRVKNQSNTV
ncbi:MAG: beta-galactosidase [Chloroflexota bacterium]